jgi:hypothetical protein
MLLLYLAPRSRPGRRAPFSVLVHAPATTARDQSINPGLPRSSIVARCKRPQSPPWVHSVNRRWAVGTLTPKLGGRWRHAQPLVSTNTTAVNTRRSSTRDLPPPCGRGFTGGISGSTRTHSSSGTSRRDNSSVTAHDLDGYPRKIQMRHAVEVQMVQK